MGMHNQPLPVSLIWPATGISLAALLIFGWRVWPGIFLGNWGYNLQVLFDPGTPYASVLVSWVIAFGSTFQAAVAYKILRTFSSRAYFNTFKDMLIFLIPGGILSCLIAATIGVGALAIYTDMGWANFRLLWVNFWVGDTFGVYLLTPLIVVWTYMKPLHWERKDLFEIFCMVLIFLAITFVMAYTQFPIGYLYIPLNLWVAYRYGLRGVTAASFFSGIVVLLLFTLQLGIFKNLFNVYPFTAVVVFLEVLFASSLLFGALSRERHIAKETLAQMNISLGETVEQRNTETRRFHGERMQKNTLYSLGLLSLGIVRLLKIPLKRIKVFTQNSLDSLNNPQLDEIGRRESIRDYLAEIASADDQAMQISQELQQHAEIASKEGLKVREVNLNEVVADSVRSASREATARFPDFSFTVLEEFDKPIPFTEAIPEYLSRALFNILLNRVRMLKIKKDKEANFVPQLLIRTLDLQNQVEIAFEDNAEPIAREIYEGYFTSLLKPAHGLEDLSMTIAHDIIVHIYRGQLYAHSTPEKNVVTMNLPK